MYIYRQNIITKNDTNLGQMLKQRLLKQIVIQTTSYPWGKIQTNRVTMRTK